MDDRQYTNAFVQNEKEANRYTIRCLRLLAVIVAFIWLLNILGIFTVPTAVMTIAAPASMAVFLAPGLIAKALTKKEGHLKHYIMIACVIGITLLASALPKHSVLAWAAPIILSCHYYSKRLSWTVTSVCIVCMMVSTVVAMYFGEWDPYILSALPTLDGVRPISKAQIMNSLKFYAFPRCMVLLGLNFACATLSTRTRKLLELQVKESASIQRLESELSIATQIQTSMLPRNFPERDEVELYATMTPAREVGGDFYDFFMVDDRHLAIVMADVSGKGVPAALFMVIGKTLIKDHTHPDSDLGDVFNRVNKLLCESNSEGLFITAFEGVLDLVTGEFTYVNAGHEMPLISRGGNVFEIHKIRPGFILAGMDMTRYRAGTLTLEPGDKIFQYTDGVTEAINEKEDLYGTERLMQVLSANSRLSPKDLLPVVKADIDRFAGDVAQFDDITMLCLEYKNRMKES